MELIPLLQFQNLVELWNCQFLELELFLPLPSADVIWISPWSIPPDSDKQNLDFTDKWCRLWVSNGKQVMLGSQQDMEGEYMDKIEAPMQSHI